MPHRWILIAGLAIAGLLALALFATESSYYRFIDSLDEVNSAISFTGAAVDEEKAELNFDVAFTNNSTLTMWVETINSTLLLDGEFAGQRSLTEGRYEIPAGETAIVPMTLTLRAAYRDQFDTALANGGTMALQGQARASFGNNNESLKTFYNVEGSFSLEERP